MTSCMKSLFLSGACVLLVLFASASREPKWMRYSAISPDGSTIAFSYQGDIYLVPSAGGNAVPLTLADAYDYMPVWSPDGASIAFASDRHGNMDVFIVAASGGEARRLTWHSANDLPSDFTPNGSHVVFSSSRLDHASSLLGPTGALPELYQVPVTGGAERQILTTPALWARYNQGGTLIVYQDQKGYEDEFRKHHNSSVTRDIWIYDDSKKTYVQLTTSAGEDLNPVFSPDQQSIYYTSEKEGSINIFRMDLTGRNSVQITSHTDHPVRYVSCSRTGLLCYTLHGRIYTVRDGSAPAMLSIQVSTDRRYTQDRLSPVRGAQEVAVSPNGKEIAFISRGEVFVASVAEGTTRRITNTPEQERSVSFSPDGRSLLYAGERNGSWNIYQASIGRKEEEFFFTATLVEEQPILDSPEETFQPSYSPDGKEVAFLSDRTALRVINLQSKAIREIVPADRNYSYSDGDQFYEWSPDGKWFLVSYLPGTQWIQQTGLISSDGKGIIRNLSKSGYGAYGPRWRMSGSMYTWITPRDGMKNHASWGGEVDVYAQYLTREAWDEARMGEEEFELYSEARKKKEEEEKKKEEEKNDNKKQDGKKKNAASGEQDQETPPVKPLVFDFEGIEDRTRRLTIHSSNLSDAFVTPDGSRLLYLCQFEKGFDLWQTNLRTKETKIVAKLGQGPGSMTPDKEGKNLFIIADGQITRFDIEKGEPKPIAVKGELVLQEDAERAYLFEHIWRQVREKFYVKDLHGVRWDFYKSAYAPLVPETNNNYDFAEMMSELLGELNASHTGASYSSPQPSGDQTASLGLLYDQDYTGSGLKVAEVLDKNPVLRAGSRIRSGVIIEKIDGQTLSADVSPYRFLNRKADTNTLLSLHDPQTDSRWEEVVRPVSRGVESELLYHRWVERCRTIVDSVSGGKLGYVHVRGMDDRSYRVMYDEVLGRYSGRDGLVVDTRYNGGGWLHDDLATFLSGKPYLTFMPRGQNLGTEPQFKWTKPSVVVMNEFNYSDAHMFPYIYRTLGIGKLVGMPVAGTGTAVWWEPLQNGVVFGIPQVGMVDNVGDYLENKQLDPDVRVPFDPAVAARGRDQQLEEAVRVLSGK